MLALIILYIIYEIISEIFTPILCMANEDDVNKTIQAVNEAAKKNINASNKSINVDKPEIHLHNPNIKIPNDLGTGIGMEEWF